MLEYIVCGFIGALIGWNLPQPFWAKQFQNYIMAKYKGVK